MKPDPKQMTIAQIERELKDFEWEYIALADKAQTDEYYREEEKKLDARRVALVAELHTRSNA